MLPRTFGIGSVHGTSKYFAAGRECCSVSSPHELICQSTGLNYTCSAEVMQVGNARFSSIPHLASS